MKPEELMIGGWVLDGTTPAQITSITCDGIIETTASEYSNIELIEPISITPEFLEKNGFRKTKGYATTTYEWTIMDGVTIYINIFEDNDIIVGIETKPKKGIGVNRLHHCEIKYVHQLQQAMRLCGINKEITLN